MSAIDFEAESERRMNWLDITGGTAITVLDYFAAAALQGMLAENGGGALDNKNLAACAYTVAQAMLKKREEIFTPQGTVRGLSGKTYG